MSYNIRFTAILVGLSLIASAASVQATLIGNDVTVARGNPTDGSNFDASNGTFPSTDGVLAVLFNAPVPSNGFINQFAIFDDSANAGLQFDAIVLHPVGGNDYQVLAVDLLTATGSGAEHLFSVPPISVSAGDLIAESGVGVPFDIGSGVTFPDIYYPIHDVPVASTTITLGSASYPDFGQGRNYALAANFVAVPEPSSFLLIAAGCGLLGLRALQRNRKPSGNGQA